MSARVCALFLVSFACVGCWEQFPVEMAYSSSSLVSLQVADTLNYSSSSQSSGISSVADTQPVVVLIGGHTDEIIIDSDFENKKNVEADPLSSSDALGEQNKADQQLQEQRSIQFFVKKISIADSSASDTVGEEISWPEVVKRKLITINGSVPTKQSYVYVNERLAELSVSLGFDESASWAYSGDVILDTNESGVARLTLSEGSVKVFLRIFVHESGTFTHETLEGVETYHWVKVGGKIWMQQNLRHNIENGGAMCWDAQNECRDSKIFGRLYLYDVALKACPAGWHLPSDREWYEAEADMYGLSYSPLHIDSVDTMRKNVVLMGQHVPVLNQGGSRAQEEFSGRQRGLYLLKNGTIHLKFASASAEVRHTFGDYWSATPENSGNILFRRFWGPGKAQNVERLSAEKEWYKSVRCVKN